ncbi:MAG: GTP 3',8-cyclase MoaA [Peptococcaceae bacterium]|nr:GTP 3',8-cyclase MoaA [Peptococcaceae bacterium]
MYDQYGRKIDYARISITDRCNLRCVYCMPESGDKLSSGGILSYEDILRVCRILAQQGIRKLKITGGEPLVRKGVTSLIDRLKDIPGIDHVSLTTNGICLAAKAERLAAAGLDSVNISLDTLDPDRYQAVTRRGSVSDVLRGIESAVSAGIGTVKVNCVPIAGVNEGDLVSLAGLAQHQDIHVRFIEMMPIGLGKNFKGIGPQIICDALTAAYGEMIPFGGRLGNGPAVYYTLPGFHGKIGFINAVSGCFCQGCNRVRLTADGMLKTCLHSEVGANLLFALTQNNDRVLFDHITRAIWNKPARHDFAQGAAQTRNETRRIMSQIGG